MLYINHGPFRVLIHCLYTDTESFKVNDIE